MVIMIMVMMVMMVMIMMLVIFVVIMIAFVMMVVMIMVVVIILVMVMLPPPVTGWIQRMVIAPWLGAGATCAPREISANAKKAARDTRACFIGKSASSTRMGLCKMRTKRTGALDLRPITQRGRCN